jgi:hypothetical protein
MVDKWHKLGLSFAGVRSMSKPPGATPRASLLTPLLNFQDVPQGP